MQNAENVLKALWKLGENGLPLERVYRQLFTKQLYLAAYAKLSKNEGALTEGTRQDDTIDGMSLGRIGRIIERMRRMNGSSQPHQDGNGLRRRTAPRDAP